MEINKFDRDRDFRSPVYTVRGGFYGPKTFPEFGEAYEYYRQIKYDEGSSKPVTISMEQVILSYE